MHMHTHTHTHTHTHMHTDTHTHTRAHTHTDVLFSLTKVFRRAVREWLVARSNSAPGQLGINRAINLLPGSRVGEGGVWVGERKRWRRRRRRRRSRRRRRRWRRRWRRRRRRRNS